MQSDGDVDKRASPGIIVEMTPPRASSPLMGHASLESYHGNGGDACPENVQEGDELRGGTARDVLSGGSVTHAAASSVNTPLQVDPEEASEIVIAYANARPSRAETVTS